MRTFKQQIMIVGLVLLIPSCQKSDHEKILGAWSGCMGNQYNEIYFFEGIHVAFVPDYLEMPLINEYQISGDSLFIAFYGGELGMNFAFHIKKITKNKLTLMRRDKIFSFDRLSHTQSIDINISKHPEKLKKYYDSYKERYKESPCYKKAPKPDPNNLGTLEDITEEDMDISDLFDSSDSSESKEQEKD